MSRTQPRTRVMGIVNVTPDSFSDGGRYERPEVAISHAIAMHRAGADVIDVGGESTRPGAEPVGAGAEIARVIPVIDGILAAIPDAVVSIDTTKPVVAEAALAAGARIVNDVSAGRDPAMFALIAQARVETCLMHMRGEPRTMQRDPVYGDVVREVRDFLVERAHAAEAAGIAAERIFIDPGIGFGKTLDHNLALLASIDAFVETGYPVVVGASRKSFIGALLDVPVERRLPASLSVAVLAALRGASIVRVHDVAETVQAIRVAEAIWAAGAG